MWLEISQNENFGLRVIGCFFSCLEDTAEPKSRIEGGRKAA